MRVLVAFVFSAVIAHGQWVNYRVKGVPRTTDGKPNLSAPAPRVNGKPDLSGIWTTVPAKPGEANDVVPGISVQAVPGDDPTTMSKYFFSALADYKDDIMTPAAVAKRRSTRPDPSGCGVLGPPMTEVVPLPHRIVQTPDLILIAYEAYVARHIHMDGRPLPVDPQPSFMGYSVGKWDGNALVVETIGINDKAPLDGMGHPRSPGSRLTQRFVRRDYGHLEIQVTVNDPTYYTKPISYTILNVLTPDDDILEYVCTENERDAPHLVPQGPPPAPPK